jgi:hypothetical protein
MSESFDPNKAIGEIVNKLTESAAAKLWAAGKAPVQSVYLDAKVYTASHKRYISKVAKDYFRSKSFLIQQTKTPLYNFYIPLGISRGDTAYAEATISNLTLTEHFNVITGSGGSGKSMMMRHLFLDTLKQIDKVPVFVELRDLNNSENSLVDLIRETLYSNKFTKDDEFFERAMKSGHFAIFLDGFDEADDRTRIAQEIQLLAKNYDENLITVSSRPDDAFSAWAQFNVWEIQPLSLDQAAALVEKVPAHVFDTKLKTKFLKDLRDTLFESHRSFLSNPLLLSIMVLTYRDSADIPTKLSVFYDQAYTTLFQRHDALKGGYKRKRFCDLDIQDFRRVFSAFSILTHDKRKSSLTETEALEFLATAKRLVNVNFKENGFLDDAIQAVSLLVRDGLIITFSHRSFQEYFAAEYIRLIPPDKQRELIRKSLRTRVDHVINLLYSIDPELVETVYLIPEISDIEAAIGYNGELTDEIYRNYLELYFEHFYIRPSRNFSGTNEKGVMLLPTFTEFGNKVFGCFGLMVETVLGLKENRYIDIRSAEQFSDLLKIKLKSEGTDLDKKYEDVEFSPANDGERKIEINGIFDDPSLLEFITLEYWPFTKELFKKVLIAKKTLVEKQQSKLVSIDEELLR